MIKHLKPFYLNALMVAMPVLLWASVYYGRPAMLNLSVFLGWIFMMICAVILSMLCIVVFGTGNLIAEHPSIAAALMQPTPLWRKARNFIAMVSYTVGLAYTGSFVTGVVWVGAMWFGLPFLLRMCKGEIVSMLAHHYGLKEEDVPAALLKGLKMAGSKPDQKKIDERVIEQLHTEAVLSKL